MHPLITKRPLRYTVSANFGTGDVMPEGINKPLVVHVRVTMLAVVLRACRGNARVGYSLWCLDATGGIAAVECSK